MSDEKLKVLDDAQEPQKEPVATIAIHCNLRTGEIYVTGPLKEQFLCLRMLAEAGHFIISTPPEVMKPQMDA